jgi:hypothetical protein
MSINLLRVIGLVIMASASAHSSTTRLAIFPLAFVMLTLSKCYVVAKTSSLPQVTTTENYAYFSSRLSMATGVLSVVAGLLFIAINRQLSEAYTLVFAALIAGVGCVISWASFVRLSQRNPGTRTDLAYVNVFRDDEDEKEVIDLSPRNRTRAIKALLTFSCSYRALSGLLTIGLGLHFLHEKFLLALLFFVAAVASFLANAATTHLHHTKFAILIFYAVMLIAVISVLGLFVSPSDAWFLFLSFMAGFIAAYSRVIYETRAATLIPLEYTAKLMSRAEIWMQLSWVIGALLAVISFSSIFLGLMSTIILIFAIAGFSSTESAVKKTTERF